jgi:hypothetical protein
VKLATDELTQDLLEQCERFARTGEGTEYFRQLYIYNVHIQEAVRRALPFPTEWTLPGFPKTSTS